MADKKYRERIYAIVSEIPKGRIMTYGQIANILGKGYTARTIGYAMYASSENGVPWQRVINSRGSCSTSRITAPANLQQILLEKEGLFFNEKGFCEVEKYRWTPESFEKCDDEEIDKFSLFGV